MNIKDYIIYNKNKLLIIFLLILLGVGSYFGYRYYVKLAGESEVIAEENDKDSLDENKDENEEKKEDKEEIEKKTNKSKKILVDIKGAVKNPNVYSLEENSRVIDLINAAGGLLNNSDTSLINLAMKLEDGMVVVVYTKAEVNNFSNYQKEREEREKLCDYLIKNNACIKDKTDNKKIDGKININTATLEELMQLPSIGKAKAEAIIKARTEKPFTKIEDIIEVSGIGEKLFDQIKKNITV